MLALVLVMVLALLVSAAVLAYVAYPHRGEDLPVAPALGEAVRRRVEALPTLDEDAAHAAEFSFGAKPHR
mgnify:CR=1 FL=1